MITVGEPPYYECSSRGDRRFSAFFARPRILRGRSIEEAYQGFKVINGRSGWSVKEAKGRRAENQEECALYYALLWRVWVLEQGLLPVLLSKTGLSDMFGRPGSVCQAEVLWRIRAELKDKLYE